MARLLWVRFLNQLASSEFTGKNASKEDSGIFPVSFQLRGNLVNILFIFSKWLDLFYTTLPKN